jgi:hypothetical protein
MHRRTLTTLLLGALVSSLGCSGTEAPTAEGASQETTAADTRVDNVSLKRFEVVKSFVSGPGSAFGAKVTVPEIVAAYRAFIADSPPDLPSIAAWTAFVASVELSKDANTKTYAVLGRFSGTGTDRALLSSEQAPVESEMARLTEDPTSPGGARVTAEEQAFLDAFQRVDR